MIEEQALVLSNNNGLIHVRVDRHSACASCQLKSGCGQKTMAKLSSNQCIEIDLKNTLSANKGDLVKIAIPEEGLINASIIVYFIPILCMLGFSIACKIFLANNDALIAVMGLAGLLAGFVFAKLYSRSHESDALYQPELMQIITSK